jgi:hypothetical protein
MPAMDGADILADYQFSNVLYMFEISVQISGSKIS